MKIVFTLARTVRAANERVAFTLGQILSWSIWPSLLLTGSAIGLYFHRVDAVMVILTIQTSIDAAATKTLQSHVRAADGQRDALMLQQIDALADLVAQVKAQNDQTYARDAIASARDVLAAKRDKAILLTLKRVHALLEAQHGGPSPATRRISRKR